MKNNKSRLSLNDFKKKETSIDMEMDIEKISGGILGSCHCYGTISSKSTLTTTIAGVDVSWLFGNTHYFFSELCR